MLKDQDTYQNDPHIRRLVMHSDDLLRRSEELQQQLTKTSDDVARLLEKDQQLNSYVNELCAKTTFLRRC